MEKKPDISPTQKVVVVAVPLELWGDAMKLLSSMPFEKVGGLMGKLMQLQPQEVEIRKE